LQASLIALSRGLHRERPAHHPLVRFGAKQAVRAALLEACKAAMRYLRVEIPYSPTAAGDERFTLVVQQLRAAIDAAGGETLHKGELI
jgi:hypothetical protein